MTCICSGLVKSGLNVSLKTHSLNTNIFRCKITSSCQGIPYSQALQESYEEARPKKNRSQASSHYGIIIYSISNQISKQNVFVFVELYQLGFKRLLHVLSEEIQSWVETAFVLSASRLNDLAALISEAHSHSHSAVLNDPKRTKRYELVA